MGGGTLGNSSVWARKKEATTCRYLVGEALEVEHQRVRQPPEVHLLKRLHVFLAVRAVPAMGGR
jgi:hypothetical protein